jgi:hypothetical protein
MKNKKYLKAAELVCTDIRERIRNFKLMSGSRSCCRALLFVGKSPTRFNELFTPEGRSAYEYYFEDYGNWADDQVILARSLALLLMYEMGEK